MMAANHVRQKAGLVSSVANETISLVCRSSSDATTSGYFHFTGNASKRTDNSTTINVIYGISRPRCELRKSTVKICCRQTCLFMDLGVQVSVLHVSVVNALCSMTEIKATSRKLQAYGGAQIATLGTVRLHVSYRHIALASFEFFVVRKGNSLMGQDLFDALGFEVRDPLNSLCLIEQSPLTGQRKLDPLNNATQQLLQSSAALRAHSELLHIDPSKKIESYVHSPVIDATMPPVVQKQHRLPLALSDKVKQEVDRLVNDRSLEPIDSSPWVCNMVIVPKANCAVRVCADLSDAIRAVIPDRYPLPTMEELGLFCRQPVLFKDRPKVGLLAGRTQRVGALPYSDDHTVGLVSMASTTVRIVERSILFPVDHGKHPSRNRRRKKPARRHRDLCCD